MRCPSCDHDNRPDRRFCTECGATLSVACPSCGAPAEAGEKFCGGCGARLPSEAPAIVVSQPAPEPEAALPAGERRHPTVLFGDLVGSTPLSQQLDAEEWRDVMAHAEARLRPQRLDGLSPDADIRVLDSVRAHVEQLVAEVHLEREVADVELERRLSGIRDAEATAGTQAQLETLKRVRKPALLASVWLPSARRCVPLDARARPGDEQRGAPVTQATIDHAGRTESLAANRDRS